MSTNRVAALRLLERVPDGAELLLMLGVVDGPPGSRFIPPDDTKDHELPQVLAVFERPTSDAAVRSESVHMATRVVSRAQFTTPPGLAAYTATGPAPEAKRTGKGHGNATFALLEANAAKESPCPSKAAWERHLRRGEDCTVCQADRDSRKRQRPPCGSPGGLMAHRHRKEAVCEPCRTVYNAVTREKMRERRAAASRSTPS